MLLELAHMYRLGGLVRACRRTILRAIRPSNAVKTLVMLDQFKDGDVGDNAKWDAIDYIKRNARDVVKTEDWTMFVSNYGDIVTDIVKALVDRF